MGCGTGIQTQALAQLGLNVTGIDISPSTLTLEAAAAASPAFCVTRFDKEASA